MPAAKKAAAKQAEPAKAAAEENVPGLDPELARIRDEALKAEPDVKVTPPDEPGIDPALVEARKKALEAEKTRKTF